MHLPDIEFFVNLGDWPLSTRNKKFPIFSWCGSNFSSDIVMPTYDITESSLENMGRYVLKSLSNPTLNTVSTEKDCGSVKKREVVLLV